MRKAYACFSIGLVVGLIFLFGQVHANTTTSFSPVSGSDSTDGTLQALTSSDITRLGTSNDLRMASNRAWPGMGAYDENIYIEFVFAPGIPSAATISSVSISHEFRRATILASAKLEIWDGSVWRDVPLALPAAINSDATETINISHILSTPSQINSAKARFLAYRDTEATSATTSHDAIFLSVSYVVATMTPASSPQETPPSTPEATRVATATPSTTPTPLPSDTPLPTPSFSPSPTASSIPAVVPVGTPIPIISTSPENSPSLITPTPSEMATPSSTAQPLLAALVSPKIKKSIRTPTPSVSIASSPTPRPKPRFFFVDILYLFTSFINMIKR